MEDKNIQWITKGGKHIPISEYVDKEPNKDRQIEAYKKEAEKYNNHLTNLTEAHIITQYPERPDKLEKTLEFNKQLEKAGFYGNPSELDDFLKNSGAWSSNEFHRQYAKEMEYEKVTALQHAKGDFILQTSSYMDYEEFKKAFFMNQFYNIGVVPDTMHAYTYQYWHGANKSGYGRGKDARIEWDKKSGFSTWLDNHPELHVNTNNTLYRGIRLSDKGIRDLQSAFTDKNQIDFAGPSSWTIREAVAYNFMHNSLVGQRNQNLAIFEEIGGGKHKALPILFGHDSELLYSGNSKFDIVDIGRDKEGIYHVKVKEARS